MKSKERIVQIIAWGTCVALLIALVLLVHTDRKRSNERIKEAQQQAESLQTEVNDNSEETLRIYDELISNLNLRSIVCWGDNELVGNEDTSFSKVLVGVINDSLFDPLLKPFGDAMAENNRTLPTVIADNMGVSGEGVDEILVRAGVDGMEVGEWALISEETEPVNIVLRNADSESTLHFAQQAEVDFGEVEILGVKGVLIKGDGEYDEDHPRFAFLRDRSGDSFQVGKGTNIEIESATKYLGSIPILFFEDDSVDTTDSVDDFVGDLQRLVQKYTEIEDRDDESNEELPYIVICTVDEDSELDNSLKEAFEGHYIRHDKYAYEMTEDDYKELAQNVCANLDGQGCFDEVKEKVNKAVEDLKDTE